MNEVLLPCGVSIESHSIDLGMRELKCECGEMHAVVTDINPLTRFLPEFLVNSLEEIIEVADSEKWPKRIKTSLNVDFSLRGFIFDCIFPLFLAHCDVLPK